TLSLPDALPIWHQVERGVLDRAARVRGVDDGVVAHVYAHVVHVPVVQDQIAGLELRAGDLRELGVLVARAVRHLHARRAPGRHRQARAVVRVRSGGAPDVRLAQLRL